MPHSSGQQYELLDWLDNITFPVEAKFSNIDFAQRTYESVVRRVIDCGVSLSVAGRTTADYIYRQLHAVIMEQVTCRPRRRWLILFILMVCIPIVSRLMTDPFTQANEHLLG